MDFTIKLSADHINVVLAGLDELQHKVSRRTLDTILQQVQAQQAAAAETPSAPATEAGLSD